MQSYQVSSGRPSNNPGWSEFSLVIYIIDRETHELISLKICICFQLSVLQDNIGLSQLRIVLTAPGTHTRMNQPSLSANLALTTHIVMMRVLPPQLHVNVSTKISLVLSSATLNLLLFLGSLYCKWTILFVAVKTSLV